MGISQAWQVRFLSVSDVLVDMGEDTDHGVRCQATDGDYGP